MSTKFCFGKLDKNYHKKRPGFTFLRRESITYLLTTAFLLKDFLPVAKRMNGNPPINEFSFKMSPLKYIQHRVF